MYSVGETVRRPRLEFYTFDQDYLRNLSRGDGETERHFVAYFSQLLSIKLRQRVRSPQEVEDLRQEVFLRVLRSLRKDDLQHPERLGAFVNSVCNHVLLEYFRAQGKDGQRTAAWSEELPEPVEPRLDSERELLGAEDRRQVRELLESLAARDQAILKALFFEERDKDQVCENYGVGRDYLRVLLHRAKNRLRVMMDRGQGSGGRARSAAG